MLSSSKQKWILAALVLSLCVNLFLVGGIFGGHFRAPWGKGDRMPGFVMMTVPENEADRPLAYDTARALRKRGINVEMYHAPKKMGDQMKYASRKQLPYVWLIRDGKHEVKDMTAQTQESVDPNTWKPAK